MDTSPSSDYHTPLVKQFNREHPEGSSVLSADALITQARKETGLERYGDESFIHAMQTLLHAAENEAGLSPFGFNNVRMRTLRSLHNRLWANECFEKHPEIAQRKIAAPLIIVGLHRSGTTRMQRMLSLDPQLQYLRTWEGFNPSPRLSLPDQGSTLRREEVVRFLQLGREIYAGAFAAHPMDADWPEEEMLLLNHSFCGFTPLGLYHIPSYYQWFLTDDKRAGYRYMAELMKLISWSRSEPEEKPWLLKNPQHMLNLPTLMETFPDAKLIFMHRDPVKTTGSILSLTWSYAVQHTDQPCRAWVRDTWTDFYEQMARRAIADREHIPAAQQIDVQYDEMNRDWRGVMRRIYDFTGMEFQAETEQAMADWLAHSAREGLHGGHRYALEDFGTTAEEVDARMKFYRERYAIPYEN